MRTPTEKQLVKAAAAKADTEVKELLDFKVYSDRVAIILGNGQKMVYHYADLFDLLHPAPEPKPVNARKGGRKA